MVINGEPEVVFIGHRYRVISTTGTFIGRARSFEEYGARGPQVFFAVDDSSMAPGVTGHIEGLEYID